MENFSLVQEFGEYEFALQVTQDILAYLDFGISNSNVSGTTRRRLYKNPFLMYWNPLEIGKYKAENPWSWAVWAGMIRHCVRWVQRDSPVLVDKLSPPVDPEFPSCAISQA